MSAPAEPVRRMGLASRPVWAEIDLDAVAHNVATLAAMVAPAQVCAVVKADGYGHGAVEVARTALGSGATSLSVALAAEGAALRGVGIEAPIVVLSQATADEVDELVASRLEAVAYTPVGIGDLADAAQRAGRTVDDPVPVHLKVDTGMHRVGAATEDAVALAKAVDAEPLLRLASLMSHCAVADEPDHPFTAVQLERFAAVRDALAAAGLTVPDHHVANTATAIDHPDGRLDRVRLGIGIYGLDPSPALAGRVDLRPALSLRARVSHVKRLAAGERVSYGLRYVTPRATTVATLPLGYADGLPRRLGEQGGEVLVGGARCPIAGTVTMDQTMVDCGDLPVEVGDEAVLIGDQGEESVGAQEWADRLGTITYEVVCGISSRVPRRYIGAEGER